MARLLASILGTRVSTGEGDFYVGTGEADLLTVDPTVRGLAGLAGNDTLHGGSADDLLFGDDFSAAWFDDEVGPYVYDYAIVGRDALFGGDGNDSLVGGPGKDSLSGGGGNDVYLQFFGGADILVELSDGGTDTIVTSATTFTLGRNFENLVFENMFTAYRKDAHGIGNAAGNWLTGGGGADTLEGLGGNDTLSGGDGLDVLTGGAGRDTFAIGYGENYGGGRIVGRNADFISDFDSSTDRFSLMEFLFDFSPWRDLTGVLKAGHFGLVGSVLTGRELVLYDQTTGELFNTDRAFAGPGSIGVFAHVTPGMILTHDDFAWY